MITKKLEKVYKETINYAKNLKGYAKRAYIAAFYVDHNLYIKQAQIIFNVSYRYVKKCLEEYKIKKEIKPQIETRGRKSVKVKYPNLANDIKSVIDNFSQTDPQFKSEKMYVRLTINQIIQLLIDTGKYKEDTLPKRSTMGNFLNKLGYNLKKVKKAKPKKKVKETDAIFDNVAKAKQKYKDDEDVVMISIDTKDRVKLGEYSRGGYNRINVQALDHDFESQYLTPFGILDLKTDSTWIYNTQYKVTADFMIDAIENFWKSSRYEGKKKLVIFLDNGPENSSRRTRFLYRLVLFADIYNVDIELVYYPPYHSKYNPIERIWARLENIWNGSLLDSIKTCLKFMNNMTWKGVKTIATLVEKEYKLGISEDKKTLNKYSNYITRKKGIEKWAVSIAIP